MNKMNALGFDLFFMSKPNNIGKIVQIAKTMTRLYSQDGSPLKVTVTMKNRKGDKKNLIDNFKARFVLTLMWDNSVSVNTVQMLELNRQVCGGIPGYTGSELYLDATMEEVRAHMDELIELAKA